MTGISEGLRNAAEVMRRCTGIEHMKACVRQDLHESTRARADEKRAELLKGLKYVRHIHLFLGFLQSLRSHRSHNFSARRKITEM